MTKSELIRKLAEDEMKKLENMDYARPCDRGGFDKYDTPEQQEDHQQGFQKYCKLREIIKYLKLNEQKANHQTNEMKKRILEGIPDWKDIVYELIKKDMQRLEFSDYARPCDRGGVDKYDTPEQQEDHQQGYQRYCQLRDMERMLVQEKEQEEVQKTPKRGFLPWTKRKPTHESFLDEER